MGPGTLMEEQRGHPLHRGTLMPWGGGGGEAQASRGTTARAGEERPPWTRFHVLSAHQGEPLTMMCLKHPTEGSRNVAQPS